MGIWRSGIGVVALALATGCGLEFEASTLAWDSRFGVDGTLDVFVPAGTALGRPAVLLLHQGGWNGGDKASLDGQAQRLARAGFVAASANYRLAPGAHFPAQVEDVRCALSFLRAHADELHLDPTRVAVLGYSAGANLAELSGLIRDQSPECPSGSSGPPAAVIAGAGPTDLLDLSSLGDAALIDFIGAPKTLVPEQYRAASPLRRVIPHAPPFLLIHGTGDLYVPSGQARAFADALEAEGNDVTLLLLEGSGHTLNPGAEPGAGNFGDLAIDAPEAWPVLLDFLHRTVGEPPR